eukprot:TRINITY_DN25612_c0_g1_i1.p1 TRINITY_DN25612_c0_g1~~TRINITY_DN25612_c0_g1_i1.p1  ORF type:complete len:435 (+),score=120.62 TRINITY_DN25612_c0_g1_i1:143-1447(+)
MQSSHGRSLPGLGRSHSAAGLPPPLPPLPNLEAQEKHASSEQHHSKEQSRLFCRPASASSSRQKKPEAKPALDLRTLPAWMADSYPEHVESMKAEGGNGHAMLDEDDDEPELGFTEEELRLEKAVEDSISELEAVDAAASALRTQLETTVDQVDITRRELRKLREVAANWDKAAAEGRRELDERQRRMEELLKSLPAECVASLPRPSSAASASSQRPPTAGGTSCSQGAEEGETSAATTSARRAELTAERVRVLEGQTTRLEDQVSEQQVTLQLLREERQKLEQYGVTLQKDRDALRGKQRDARAETRAAEGRLKSREDEIATLTEKRQALERQAMKLRGEAHGIRSRLGQSAGAQKAVANIPSERGRGSSADLPGGEADANAAEDTDAVSSVSSLTDEEKHALSLEMQKKIVTLWAALRACDEETKDVEERLK